MSHATRPSRPSWKLPANPPADPPTAADWRRNDLALYATVLILLLLGWAVARQARDLAQSVSLGMGLPTVSYPAEWTRGAAGNDLLYARNPASPGAYNAAVTVSTRPVLQGDTLDSVRTAVGFQRSRTLDRYRELEALPVSVLGGAPAVLTSYAFIADPTGQSGLNGLPVVVQGQDLIFRSGSQWVVASTSSDAATAAAEADAFELFFRSFDLVRSAAGVAPASAPAPATGPADAGSADTGPAVQPAATADAPAAQPLEGQGGFQGQPATGVKP